MIGGLKSILNSCGCSFNHFFPQDLKINSPFYPSYISFKSSSENLVLGKKHIPCFTDLLENVLIL